MLPFLLTNFEIQRYYQNEPQINSVFSKNLHKIKDGTNVINLDETKSVGNYWIDLYVNNNVTYFDSFRVEHNLKEVIGNKNIMSNLYRIQAYNSIMRGFFYIGVIDFMLKDKSLPDYTFIFS